MPELDVYRQELNYYLDQVVSVNDAGIIVEQWQKINPLLTSWWTAYKAFERQETWHRAYFDDRMSVRTFDAGFMNQVSKKIGTDIFNIPTNRIYADSNYTPLSKEDKIEHKAGVRDYWAYRGIDSSPFENPENFVSRDAKYKAGVHDQSASLLNHIHPIFAADFDKGGQVHSKSDGAHFSFLPISTEEDQELLYNLVRCAKYLKNHQLYTMVRCYRAEMTRIKLAGEEDLGVGFVAVPVANPGTGSKYKLRYGMKTGESYLARKEAVRKFKQILNKQVGPYKNEIVVAVRKHEGPFPIYAKRFNQELHCYTIENGRMRFTGRKISIMGAISWDIL
jgi:hypothetical protein